MLVERTYRTDLDIRTAKRIIEGRAVPYGRPEKVSDDGRTSYFEEWAPGSFQRSSLPANRGRTSIFYTHLETDLNRLGRPVDLEERADGLYGQWRIDETPMGDLMLEYARDGHLQGLSISADVVRTARRGEVRVRAEGRLRHVALVEEPAYADALVTAVRAAQHTTHEDPGTAAAASAETWVTRLARMRGARDRALH